ncbi:hypothetical protein VCHENC02_2956, partial [Vibrio harveyi]
MLFTFDNYQLVECNTS